MPDTSFKRITTDTKTGRNSTMSILELKDFIDFEVKRVYFIQDNTGNTGQHAHHNEKECFIMVKGTCTAIIDKGEGLEDIRLVGPHDGICVANYVWHGFKDFEPGSVLLALSSTNYSPDRSDYLEDYQEYKDFLAQL